MISCLCPTRNRPQGVRRLIKTVGETADGPVEFVFYQDEDAQYQSDVYEVPAEYQRNITVKVVTGPRIMQSDTWNKCAEQASGDVYMQCDDDVAFRSAHWDTIVSEAINKHSDRLAVVYGRDGVYEPPECATQLFTSRRWVEVLGYLTPPYFTSDYSDSWINDLAIRIGRREYLPEVFTEHMHPNVGKAVWDKTYEERLTRHAQQNPGQIWKDTEPERARDAERLRQAMMNG